MQRVILAGQGLYYMATGLWALFDLDSFERVTGPKVDTWLVKTVGALVTVIGGVLVVAGLRRRPGAESQLLAAGSALALAAVEAFYAGKGRISRVYLLDAVAELAGVAALGRAAMRDTAVVPAASPR